jgi:hypothetical protein
MSVKKSEKNEWEKTMLDMKENSRRLRDLRPPNERHNNIPINKDTSALYDTTHMILNVLTTLTKKVEDAKIKVKREQSKRISSLVKKEITNEAIHGILKIIYSSLVTIKLFWSFSIVVSMGLFSYLVLQTIVTYLNFGVNTSFRNIVENPTDFPKVTVCK